MAFRFNLITDEGAQGLEAYYQELIDKNTQGHFRYEAEMSLAYLSWRKGDGAAMREHFCKAASQVVDQLSEFQSFGSTRVITAFETPLLIVNLFGSQQEKLKLSSIPRDAWFYPKTSEFLPLADVLEIINQILTEKTIDLKIIEKIEQENSCGSANKFYCDWIVSICNALRAILEKDEKKLKVSMLKILELHEKETDEGAWRKRVEAMVSLWACVIYKIANNISLVVDIESPYMPKKFI